MNWDERFREGEKLLSERNINGAIEHYQKMMEDSKDEPKIHYWALKHIGDAIGYAGAKDYMQSIDLYQKIINEYEGEDALYNWCQLDIAKAYLELGLEMMSNFDNMKEIIEIEDKNMNEYFEKLMDKRNQYIERAAEIIYKERM